MRIMNLASLEHTLQNLGSSQVMSGFSTRKRKKTTMKTQEQTHRSASLSHLELKHLRSFQDPGSQDRLCGKSRGRG